MYIIRNEDSAERLPPATVGIYSKYGFSGDILLYKKEWVIGLEAVGSIGRSSRRSRISNRTEHVVLYSLKTLACKLLVGSKGFSTNVTSNFKFQVKAARLTHQNEFYE